jgi:hypothetical protein
MSTKYIVEDALFAREDANGNIVQNPTVLQVCITEFGVKEERDYKEIDCLLTEGTEEVEGTSKVSGGFKFPMEASTLHLLQHLIGEKNSVEDATSDTWASDTVMAIGDQVNTSDGKWTLTVQRVTGDAKTGSDEPTPTETDETVTDNNVVWKALPKLIKVVIPFGSKVPKFRAELTLRNTEDDTIVRKQYQNLEMDKFPVTIKDGGEYEFSVDTTGGIAVDEDSPLWTKDFMSEEGAKLAKADNVFIGGACELTGVLIDGSEKPLDSIELTIDKGLSEINMLNCKKRTQRKPSVKGKATLEFSLSDYRDFRDRKSFDFTAEIKSKNGASVLWEFPKCTPKFTEIDAQTKTEVLLSPDFTVVQKDTETPLCTATIIVPSLINSEDGTIIGDGSW